MRILRQHIERLGYKRNFVIYDESEQLGAIKKILSHISAKGEKTDPAAILGLLSRYQKRRFQAQPPFADPGVAAMAEHIRSRYETALRACNAVDFDDLILLTLRLFTEHPDALEACRAKYRYVMVDEYQDTNAAQFKLVHSAHARASQSLRRRRRRPEHLRLARRGNRQPARHGKAFSRGQSHQAGAKLPLHHHHPAGRQRRHQTQRPPPRQTVVVAKGPGPKKIVLHAFSDDEAEARAIVEQIEYARLASRVPWADQAILFRTNIQSRALETALRQAGVRYHLIGGQSYFDRREVRDFLAYLKIFINPNDDVSLLRIANVPARGLSDVTMERLLAASQERKCSVFAAMKNPRDHGDIPGPDARKHRGLRRVRRTAPGRNCTRAKACRCTSGPNGFSTRPAISTNCAARKKTPKPRKTACAT